MSKLTAKEVKAIVPQHVIDLLVAESPQSFGAVLATQFRKEHMRECLALKRQLACESRVKPASFVGSQTIAKVDRKLSQRSHDDISYDKWCRLHDSLFDV
jgi:hypothetical protein